MRVAILGIIFVSFLFLIPLFQTGFYRSHDGEAHVARFAAYYQAYSDGQFPARWAGNLNQGFGSPVFIFYYPLPGTLASILHGLGLSFETSFKALIGASFGGAAIFFYFWLVRHVGQSAAFLAALFYGLAPYHFLNTYVRGDIAEMMALAFAPLVLLFIDKTIAKPTVINIVLGAGFYCLLILSHNAISLIFSPIFLGYIFFETKFKKKATVTSVLILIGGLCLSAFFWIPALYESRYTNVGLFIGDMFQSHFPTLKQLVYSPWGFGPEVRASNGLSPQIGPLHIVIIVVGFLLLLYKRRSAPLLFYFWCSMFVLTIFMTISASAFFWQHAPLLKLLQFPWRITALSSFTAAVIIGYILNQFHNKKMIFLTMSVLLLLSVPFTKIEPLGEREDGFYRDYKGTTYYHGQASSIWTAGDPGEKAREFIEVIAGEAIVSNVERRSNRHVFEVDAKTESRILDNTTYFPGWQVLVAGRKIPIEFQDVHHRGLVTFVVPQGRHTVQVKFVESPIRLFSDIISLGVFVAFTVMLIFKNRLQRFLRL